jgi:magnesium chelatase family protein
MAIRRYQGRLSGPILDRIDIQAHIVALRRSLVAHQLGEAEPSAAVAQRVASARDRQAVRLRHTPWRTNAELPGGFVRRELPQPPGMSVLDRAVASGSLSARGTDKVIKIAWTLADLAGATVPDGDHLAMALALRQGEETS